MLQLVAVPIGDHRDITLRAIEALRAADIVIGEERKEVSKLLRRLEIEGKELAFLNEHSRDDDVAELLSFCRERNVALVTDCGTPGFCDPGSRLVAACRAAGVPISPLPGASSLMCLLSVAGIEMREFLFRGFLPADREQRARALRDLDRERRPIVMMDTPYRLARLLSELSSRWPARRAVIGMDFTQATEEIVEAPLNELVARVGDRKAEFVIVVLPSSGPSSGPASGPVSGSPGGPTAGPAPRHRNEKRKPSSGKPTHRSPKPRGRR